MFIVASNHIQKYKDELYDSSDDEIYQDATEEIAMASSMDFYAALEEIKISLNLFLNNHFEEAKHRLSKWADTSMYHSQGYAVILYLQAAMTFEMADIQLSSEAVKVALRVIVKRQKRGNILENIASIATSTNYNAYTTEEVHAELCYAETLIFKSMLTIIQDESLMALIKTGLKLRSCFNAYKECYKILEKRDFTKDKGTSKIDFESGVRFGIGTFNLMISLLPTKILKLLEFVGFSGNKMKGLSELQKGAILDNSVRSPLCALVLLSYHTVITFFLGTYDSDLNYAKELLAKYLAKYPKGAFFLFFAGRMQEVSGNIDGAILKFEECMNSQDEWTQFKHVCYWELMWCHAIKEQWTISMKYAEMLSEQSKWSKVIYYYQKAAFLMMLEDKSESLINHVEDIMQKAPSFKQRIAGKSIPMEKFAIRKCARYFAQNKRLFLPGYELLYIWNLFNVFKSQTEFILSILNRVEISLEEVRNDANLKTTYPYYYDDLGLLLLLKGVCVRYLQKYDQALELFQELQNLDKDIKDDLYLVPFSFLETAHIYLSKKNYVKSLQYLEHAKQKKGSVLENRLHFRCHALKSYIDTLTGNNQQFIVDEFQIDVVRPDVL